MPTDTLSEAIAAAAGPTARPRHPLGWEPGIEWNGRAGTITSRPIAEPTPDWDSLLKTWGFDPEVVEIVEPVQVRTWDAAIGDGAVRTMWYYRAGVRQRRANAPDIDELIAEFRRHRPRKPAAAIDTAGGAFLVAPADWQIGKKGTAETVRRWAEAIPAIRARYTELRKIGRPLEALYVASLGDLHEGCRDHYAQQTFEVELDKREQRKLVRRMWLDAVTTWAPDFKRVVLTGIGGNHGEERAEGKSYTTFGDNVDVAVLEDAAEVIAASRALKHVSSVIPDQSLTMTLDIAGTITAFAHGHQARRSGQPQQKIREWWKGQMYGKRPAGDADLLLTGHFHHLTVTHDGYRTHIQAPTLDSGSQWYEESAGVPTDAGTLTLVVGGGRWSDLQVIR